MKAINIATEVLEALMWEVTVKLKEKRSVDDA